ncbi:hypothetical protein HN011_003354 [Eciton burchellii]|nr:hypothetical protein HN011_003354 [Eciton burchellii]
MTSSFKVAKTLHQPEYLRSPTWVLHYQKGNSFECATVFVSLLLGQGYNAFVVSGYASREQVFCDLTKITCPYLPEKEEEAEETPPPTTDVPENCKYRLKPALTFKSQFLQGLEDLEEKRKELELRYKEEERQKMIAESERPRPDKYFGRRVHAWVLLLPGGLRDEEIVGPTFIEPSSGISYPINQEVNSLYPGVESVWNNRNYWVNMQPRGKGSADINWDLNNVRLWEHLLPGEPYTTEIDTSEIDEAFVQQQKHLDMPASYVNEIQIESIDYERQYPRGSKTMFYKKTKVELYAPYFQMDGLIQRITTYDDYEYTAPLYGYEKYLHRNDNLVETRRDFDKDTVTDFFERGRSDHCKVHRYIASKNETIDSERVIDFYDRAQVDGLSRIDTGPLHLTQHYVDREDLLYYRHAEFMANSEEANPKDIHFRHIAKIIDKYYRNAAIPASKDVAIRVFDMVENKILINYHYEKDRCSRATRTFIKPLIAQRESLVLDPSMAYGYDPDALAPLEKELDLFYDLQKYLDDENYAVSYIRNAETEIAAFLKRRADDILNLELTIRLFDENRIVDVITALEMEAVKRPTKIITPELEVNPLGPFLARMGNPTHVTVIQEYLLKDHCLTHFKQQSVDKANRIVRMIEKRTAELEKAQAQMTETLTKAEEEQLLAKINEISFIVHVLEAYLARHRELVPKKYKALVEKLEHYPF